MAPERPISVIDFANWPSDDDRTYAVSHEMLAHRLHPMQSQTVQHGARAFHDAQDEYRKNEPHVEDDYNSNDTCYSSHTKCYIHSHVPQHDRKTLMRERKGP